MLDYVVWYRRGVTASLIQLSQLSTVSLTCRRCAVVRVVNSIAPPPPASHSRRYAPAQGLVGLTVGLTVGELVEARERETKTPQQEIDR